VNIAATDPDASEAGPDVGVFTFARSGGNLAVALSVFHSTSGTAVQSSDYLSVGGSVVIPANQTSATVTITPRPDNSIEGAETAVMSIDSNASYLIGPSGSATVTIAGSPAIVTVTANDAIAAEAGADPGVFTFSRSGGDTSSVLNIFVSRSGTATNGSDYASLGGGTFLVTIPANQTTATVIISPLADNLVEGPETVVLTIQPGSTYIIGADSQATVTIADDPPVVSVTATTPTASETGPVAGVFTFTRSGGNLAAALTVNFSRTGTATNNVDYANIGLSVTILANATVATVTITPIDDPGVEGPETVILTITASSNVVVGASGSATVTIEDND
jgi:hypothetical protein